VNLAGSDVYSDVNVDSNNGCYSQNVQLELDRQRWFPFRKRSMPFLTVDAIIGNQAFQNERCPICINIGLDKVETGFNLLIE